jgi:hypothetical protein
LINAIGKARCAGQPLPLPFDGLWLGRQSAREAASPVDAGKVVSCLTEEAVPPDNSISSSQRFESACGSHRVNLPTHQARPLTTAKPT